MRIQKCNRCYVAGLQWIAISILWGGLFGADGRTFYPLISIPAYSDDGNGRSHIFRRESNCGANNPFYANLRPMLRDLLQGISAINTLSERGWIITPAFDLVLPGNWSPIGSQSKGDDIDFRVAVFRPYKYSAEDVFHASDPSLVFRSLSVSNEKVGELVNNPTHKRIESRINRPSGTQGIPCYFSSIKECFAYESTIPTNGISAKPERSVHGEKHAINVFEFAGEFNSTATGSQAIGPQDSSIGGPRDNHGCCPSAAITKQEQKQNARQKTAMRYIRRNCGSISYHDPIAGNYYEDVKDSDYDVSGDAKHWFHLVGEICYQKCPPLIVHLPKIRK